MSETAGSTTSGTASCCTAPRTIRTHSSSASEGRFEDAELASVRYKNVLVSALGIDSGKPKVEVGEENGLAVGDTFLLASDGLWGHFSDDELGDVLASMAPRQASEHLVSLARERGNGRGDNVSLAIVRLDPSAPAKRRFQLTASG